MSRFIIPNPVIAVVAEELAHRFTHQQLNTQFAEHGAPGEPPEGNKALKCSVWLKRVNQAADVDAAKFLGAILQNFMEVEPSVFQADPELPNRRERVSRVLAKYSLEYRTGGFIFGATVHTPTRSLESILRGRDLASVDQEFQRALATIESDPGASVTAACAILEALCKTYIEDERLQMPKDQSLKPLWATVQKNLRLDPASHADDDLKRILQGLSSVADGLGAYRTHAGSAHGRGRSAYRLKPRHARLALHAAHTLVNFVIETWDARKMESAPAENSAQ